MLLTPTAKVAGANPFDWRVHVRYRNAKGQVREKVIANRPVSQRDEDWHIVNEEWAKRNALDLVTWGWRRVPGWGGFRIRLSERPEDVLDVRIVRRHEDKSHDAAATAYKMQHAEVGGQ